MATAWENAIAGMERADRSKVFSAEFEKCGIKTAQLHEYFSLQTVRRMYPECHPHYYGLHHNGVR